MAILAALSLPVIGGIRKRAQRLQCMGNLRSLHVAAEQYVQDNNQWPQIKGNPTSPAFAQKWIAALSLYKIRPKTWICPTIENALGNPDYSSPEKERVDLHRHAIRRQTDDAAPVAAHAVVRRIRKRARKRAARHFHKWQRFRPEHAREKAVVSQIVRGGGLGL
jgi:hypothetical protein